MLLQITIIEQIVSWTKSFYAFIKPPYYLKIEPQYILIFFSIIDAQSLFDGWIKDIPDLAAEIEAC